jgi:hypothetical protein
MKKSELKALILECVQEELANKQLTEELPAAETVVEPHVEDAPETPVQEAVEEVAEEPIVEEAEEAEAEEESAVYGYVVYSIDEENVVEVVAESETEFESHAAAYEAAMAWAAEQEEGDFTFKTVEVGAAEAAEEAEEAEAEEADEDEAEEEFEESYTGNIFDALSKLYESDVEA